MSSAATLFDMRISGSRRASAARAGSREGKTLSVTAMTGRATEYSRIQSTTTLALPAYDAGHAVDPDLRAIGNFQRCVQHAEHHGNPALARKRVEVRVRAAELGHHAGHPRQDLAERRPRHLGHPNVA